MLSTLISAGFFLLLAIASASDLRSGRIPNALTFPALIIALMLRLLIAPEAFLTGVLGAALMLVVGIGVLALGAFGGGDAKLLVAVGAFLGPRGAATALLVAGLAGGVLALLIVARRRILFVALHNTRQLVRHWLSRGRSGRSVTLDSPEAITVPYGVAIAIGGVCAWLAGGIV